MACCEDLGQLTQSHVGLKQNWAQSGTVTWRDSQKKGDSELTPMNRLLPDSLVVGTLVDGVIVVTKEKSTSFALVEDTKKKLENVGANILGVVLNNTEVKKNKYYGGYYGKYYE